ncbi:MAG: hypothetical protein ACI8T1_000937 [Verrucomicrobiales bacterium]|jgi:hypothetical protein
MSRFLLVTFTLFKPENFLLDIALDPIALARAQFYRTPYARHGRQHADTDSNLDVLIAGHASQNIV